MLLVELQNIQICFMISNFLTWGGSGPNVFMCGPNDLAILYETGLTGGVAQTVILLCQRALNSGIYIGPRCVSNWENVHMDDVSSGLSVTFVHEFMHAVGGASITHTLPSGRREKYSCQDILDLPDSDKKANAEGYAKVASALWLRFNKPFHDGDYRMGPRYLDHEKPAKGTHMNHVDGES